LLGLAVLCALLTLAVLAGMAYLGRKRGRSGWLLPDGDPDLADETPVSSPADVALSAGKQTIG
jgi:hypothetical protein